MSQIFNQLRSFINQNPRVQEPQALEEEKLQSLEIAQQTLDSIRNTITNMTLMEKYKYDKIYLAAPFDDYGITHSLSTFQNAKQIELTGKGYDNNINRDIFTLQNLQEITGHSNFFDYDQVYKVQKTFQKFTWFYYYMSLVPSDIFRLASINDIPEMNIYTDHFKNEELCIDGQQMNLKNMPISTEMTIYSQKMKLVNRSHKTHAQYKYHFQFEISQISKSGKNETRFLNLYTRDKEYDDD